VYDHFVWQYSLSMEIRNGGDVCIFSIRCPDSFCAVEVTIMFIMIRAPKICYQNTNIGNEPEDRDAKLKEQQTTRLIEFQVFSYLGAEKPVLTIFSFSALPGQVTAIIRRYRCRQSTLVNLIPRFYDIESGKILVDV